MPRIARWALPALVALLALVYGAVAYLMASGVTKADREAVTESPQEYGLPYEEVTFTPQGEDLTLRGWYIHGGGDRPTVVFVHGFNVNREADEALDLARRLYDEGFDILMFDLRGHGESGGQRVSGGYYERRDLQGAVDFLIGRGVEPGRIGALGFSMGAAIVLLTAAQDPRIGAVVADSSYADVSDLIAQETARKTVFPQWLVPAFVPGMKFLAHRLYGIDIGALVPERAVARLDYPVLIIHGLDDDRIPPQHARRIGAAAPDGSLVWLVPQVGHTDAFATYPDMYVQKVTAYLRERLGQ